MTDTKNAQLKHERDLERFIASEVVDGLRGKHPTALVRNVYGTEEDYEDEEVRLASGKSFRVLGANRGSVWGMSDYAVLILSTFFSSPHDIQPKAYSVTISEHAFEEVRARLKLKKLACGNEHFYLTRKKTHPLPPYPCPLCELLATTHRPFVGDPDGWRRNTRYISEVQVEVALELGRAAKVEEVEQVFSLN